LLFFLESLFLSFFLDFLFFYEKNLASCKIVLGSTSSTEDEDDELLEEDEDDTDLLSLSTSLEF